MAQVLAQLQAELFNYCGENGRPDEELLVSDSGAQSILRLYLPVSLVSS
jgi:hypothetical protein